MRHDPVASPQDGTPTKQASDQNQAAKQAWQLVGDDAMGRVKDTRALNATQSIVQPHHISWTEGETPVELCQQPSVFCPLSIHFVFLLKGENYARKEVARFESGS